EGAEVILADRHSAAETADAIRASGGDTWECPVDVGDEAAVLRLFEILRQRRNRLDILVNNAGILIEKPLLETSVSDFDRLMAVNLRGTFLVSREALRMMVAGSGGRVINVASELAYL